MRARVGWLFVCPFVWLVGCGEATPPLEELPLRDALQAAPSVVAALPDSARALLAARFALAATSDTTAASLAPPADNVASPAALVRALDAERERRSTESLIVGSVDGGTVRALSDVASTVDEHAAGKALFSSLLPLEGDVAPALTAALEARGLAGDAGRSLSALLTRSKAVRLQRVSGWPVGAVTIGDTIYVNAAWLIALGSSTGGAGGSAGVAEPSGPAAVVARPPIATAGATMTALTTTDAGSDPDAGSAPDADAGAGGSTGWSSDGGVVIVVPPPSDGGQTTAPPPPVSADDSCAASLDVCSACAASSDDSGENCGSTDDDDSGCDSSGDDSGCGSGAGDADSCQNSDDGNQCSMSGGNRSPHPRREQPRRSGTLAVLLAPLVFLLKQRRA